ncbi:hypothetical protein [uncultured Clostridium sp.]|uniref:hypothetical protein n=1 Tax=uncultured Clostridium sp. TaxID=59620 RepID=UPI0028EE6624|nr:hypothetical protein [uncultured Clostridium sp.]
MDIGMIYKETFLENFEKITKNVTRFYAIIENKDGNPIGEINSIEVIGSNTTLEIGLLIAEESSRDKGIGIRMYKIIC